jgi:hypothetical protein
MELTLALTEQQAMALAQLAKRFTHEDATRLSNRYDENRECKNMLDAIGCLQEGLAKLGIAPR